MKTQEENVQLFFKGIEEVNQTSRELYDAYVGENFQISQDGNSWTVSYLDKQITASEEEGIYPFLPIISYMLLDCLTSIREHNKKAESGERLYEYIRYRNDIVQFITNEFLTKKYTEKVKKEQPVKQMVEAIWQFQGKVRTCVQTKAAQNIVDCLSIQLKDNIYYFKQYNKLLGGELSFYILMNEKQNKTELFCFVAYIHEMRRRIKKQMARRKSKQFQEDAKYLLAEIQELEKLYIH